MRTSRWPLLCLAVVAVGTVTTACNPAHRAEQAKKIVDNGSSSACAVERSTIQAAVDAYTLMNPDAPVTEAAMVSGGFIHEQSQLMDVTAVGVVVPALGSICA